MKKIVVTTDLSKNSKAGLKFAIQLASQHEVKLIFFHAVELLIPTRWNDVKAKVHMDEEIHKEAEILRKFVAKVYKECKKKPGKFECVVRYGAPVSNAVLEFANEIKASFICLATRGAGKLKRLVGTHASAIIRKSTIPVFAIPKNYKQAAIREILYASDLTALGKELRKVSAFANKLDSSVSVVHYDNYLYPKEAQEAFTKITDKVAQPDVQFYLEKYNWEKSMNWHFRRAVRKFKADLLTMFSDHKRPWLQRILEGSHSAEMSFDSVRPILVYPKLT